MMSARWNKSASGFAFFIGVSASFSSSFVALKKFSEDSSQEHGYNVKHRILQKFFRCKNHSVVSAPLPSYHFNFCCNKTLPCWVEQWARRNGLELSWKKRAKHLALLPSKRINCFGQCDLAIVMFFVSWSDCRNQYRFHVAVCRHLDWQKIQWQNKLQSMNFRQCHFIDKVGELLWAYMQWIPHHLDDWKIIYISTKKLILREIRSLVHRNEFIDIYWIHCPLQADW